MLTFSLLSAWLFLAALCSPLLAAGDAVDLQLYKAAAANDATATKALLDRGAYIDARDGTGATAYFADGAYVDCEVATAQAALAQADVLLKVQPPSLEEIPALKEGAVVIGNLQPHLDPERTKALRDRRITRIGTSSNGSRSRI